jgi:hypothetical protein
MFIIADILLVLLTREQNGPREQKPCSRIFRILRRTARRRFRIQVVLQGKLPRGNSLTGAVGG